MRNEKMEITKYFLDQVKEIDGVKVAGKKTVEGRLGVVSIDFEGFDNSIVSFSFISKTKLSAISFVFTCSATNPIF